jgi:glucan biosynthesis protein C
MSQENGDKPFGQRIDGLDTWRVLLMLGGLLLHGSYWQPAQPLFTAVGLISNTFRMGCFFAISGFLSGLSMRKHSSGRWLVRRSAQIGLPTLFGWGLLCPLIWLLAAWYPYAPTPLPFDWHHIWFMVALLPYAVAAVVVDALDRRFQIVDGFAGLFCGRRTLLAMLLSVSAVSFILMAGTAMLVHSFTSPALLPTLGQARNIAGYLPNYLFGVAMARSTPVALAVQRSWRSALAIVVVTGSIYALWLFLAPALDLDAAVRDRAGDLATVIAESFCPPAIFALIFRSAVAVRHVTPFFRKLADASLTIYLLHLPVLLAINALLSPLRLHPYAQYALAIAAAGTATYAVHVWIVRPVPLLLLLVNGRIDQWRRRKPGRSEIRAGRAS